MNRKHWKVFIIAGMGFIFLFSAPLLAKYYEWLPKGGTLLLEKVIKNYNGWEDLKTLLNSKKTEDEWILYFQSKPGALKDLTDKEVKTLASYLAYNIPNKKVKIPKNIKKFKFSKMPIDGQNLLLTKCSLCHPIGPPLMQDREVEGWRSAYHLPPHPQLKLPQHELETLIHYLAYNLPLPIDVIPEELQAELPGY